MQDEILSCPKCGADMHELSTTAVAIKEYQANPRVGIIRVHVNDDACPACAQLQGAYPKDKVPRLPVEGCSHKDGCRCFYAPALTEISP